MEQGIIDKIVSQKAFDEVNALEKAILDVVKAGKEVGIGGGKSKPVTYDKELNKMIELTEKARKATEDATKAAIQREIAEKKLKDVMGTLSREEKLQSQINGSLAGSYNQMQAQLSKNLITLKALSEEQRNNAEIGGKLITENAKLNSSLKAIDATMGMNQRNVGNYKSGLFGMSQVLREMPNFAIDARIGFMSLSNNLPYLADEFKKVKETMVEVKDEFGNITQKQAGTKAAFKAMAGSIISVNTVMVLLSTALVLFGDKLVDWIGGLFKAEKVAKDFVSVQGQMHSAFLKGSKDAQDEAVKLDVLYGMSQNVKMSMTERKKAVDELQKKYPDYFGNLTDEQILLGKGKKSYDELTEALYRNAITRASLDKITENSKEILTIKEMIDWRTKFIEKAKADNQRIEELRKTRWDPDFGAGIYDENSKKIKAYTGDIVGLENKLKGLNNVNDRLKDSITNVGGLIEDNSDKSDKQTESINTLKTRSEAWLEILKASATQSRTAAQQYGALQVAIENLQYQLDTEKFKDDATALSNLAIEHAATLEKIAKETNDNLSQAPLLDESKKVQSEHATFLENSWKEIQRINDNASKDEKRRLKLDQEEKKKIIQEGLQAITQLYDIFAEHQQYLIDSERDAKLKQLEMNTEAELNNESLTADQKIDINEAYKAQKNQIEKEAFEQEKQLKIATVAMDAAVAEVKIIAETAGNPLLLAVLSGILATTTAASIAQIAAQQYPAFEKGGIMDHDGIALVGEKRHELGVTPDGSVFLTPNVPTLMHLQKGTEIYPDASAITSEMIAGLTMKSNVYMDFIPLQKTMKEVLHAIKELKPSEKVENLHEMVKFARTYKN